MNGSTTADMYFPCTVNKTMLSIFTYKKTNALVCIILLFIALCLPVYAKSNEKTAELPVLTDHLSGIISLEEEQVLGKYLTRQIRAQLPIINDPLSNEYLQSISYRLAENSELAIKSLTTLLIKDPSINAFAMPGNVIASNTGLFRYAETEAEFSSVLAHELAHLSQRHFARMIAEQQSQKISNLGAYLASVLVLLTVGAEPGMGALAATQAASQQSALRFSRKNEREADRIGIQTLAKTGINTDAMATFFIKLQQSSQYAGDKPPEYMLSHPVTESRIADARSRSSGYPKQQYTDSLDFHLIKNRLAVIETNDLKSLINNLEASAQKSSGDIATGIQYGLVIAYTEDKQFEKARSLMKKIQKNDPVQIAYLLASAEIEYEKEDFELTRQMLESALEIHPNNYPLSMLYAETLIRNREISEAIYLLESFSLTHKNEPYIWRRLADAHGLKGNRLGVYLAKAEYFYLFGLNEQALAQLNYALPLAKKNYQLSSKIETRIESIKKEEKEIKL